MSDEGGAAKAEQREKAKKYLIAGISIYAVGYLGTKLAKARRSSTPTTSASTFFAIPRNRTSLKSLYANSQPVSLPRTDFRSNQSILHSLYGSDLPLPGVTAPRKPQTIESEEIPPDALATLDAFKAFFIATVSVTALFGGAAIYSIYALGAASFEDYCVKLHDALTSKIKGYRPPIPAFLQVKTPDDLPVELSPEEIAIQEWVKEVDEDAAQRERQRDAVRQKYRRI